MSETQERPSSFLRSVRGRLLIAFGLIVILSLAIGSIGWSGFSDTKTALNSLSQESLPEIARTMELARVSSSVASVAPFIASQKVLSKLNSESLKLEEQLAMLRGLVAELEPVDRAASTSPSGSMADLAGRLEADLLALVDNTKQSLNVLEDMLERRFEYSRSAAIEAGLQAEHGGEGIAADRLHTFNKLVALVLAAGTLDTQAGLDQSEAAYVDYVGTLIADTPEASPLPLERDLRRFLDTQSVVFDLRRRELAANDKMQYLLSSILAVSKLMAERVSEVVASTTATAQARSLATNEAVDIGRQRILLLTIITMAVAVMAGLYILRNVVTNLQGVTRAMTRLAGGDRNVSVPAIERLDELGNLARAFNIFKEQSFEREALSSELIEKSRTLEAAFANMTDGLSVFDMEGALVAWNAQFIALNELDPASVRQGVHFSAIFDQLIAAGVKFTGGGLPIDNPHELMLLRQRGAVAYEQIFPSKRVVELRSRPMDGGFATIYTDQTDRRAYEERIRQAQRMEAVGQLTSGLAHDFNNLLATVSGNLEMLEGALRDRPDLSPRLWRAMEASERGAEVTQRLLAFSRQQALKPEPTDVNALIESLLELLDFNIGDNITIRTELASDAGFTVIDQAQLENAILNLIFNARDAMPSGGAITLRTTRAVTGTDIPARETVIITVEDEGVGMSPDVLSRVFEPFFSTKAKGSGTGLGLSMVYGFVVQSGGEVRLESEEGRGTTVIMSLPGSAANENAPPSTRSSRPDEHHAPRGNETVLVVEDDRAVSATAVDMLEGLGYEVLVAATLEQARQHLEARHVDLVFTDYLLPENATGDDVAVLARNLQPDIVVLYTSGFPRDKLQRNAPLSNDAVLLAKPYKLQALAQAVRSGLDQRQSNPKRSTLLLRR
jgi:signal transduction histidine kinase/HAMP domain-containing protein/ActR/RegA family two-component response regulator